jgi:hypothetical protein
MDVVVNAAFVFGRKLKARRARIPLGTGCGQSIFIAAPQWRSYMSQPKGGAMRAEIERAAEEIKQALALLRRHL